MTILSAKACFLKVKMYIILLYQISLKQQDHYKLKNLFLLLSKLKLKKFNVPITLQVESASLICVSVNPIMLINSIDQVWVEVGGTKLQTNFTVIFRNLHPYTLSNG